MNLSVFIDGFYENATSVKQNYAICVAMRGKKWRKKIGEYPVLFLSLAFYGIAIMSLRPNFGF